MIKVNFPAPEFKLSAFSGGDFSEVSLASLRGKWVYLCFYPGDFTFVWASEIATVVAKHEEFKSLDVQVLTISPDSQFVHKMWADKEILGLSKSSNIPFPMLADTNAELAKEYGTYDEDAKLTLRGSFIIDPDGIVQVAEVLSAPLGRNYDEILRRVRALQMIRESKGTQAAPCEWQPGKNTIQPSLNLVGNMKDAWMLD